MVMVDNKIRIQKGNCNANYYRDCFECCICNKQSNFMTVEGLYILYYVCISGYSCMRIMG